MQSLTLILHVALAVGVIGLVLIQHGKGADAGAAFGSGASSTVFGARGSASFLTRLTTILAALFFVTSLILFYLAAHRDRGMGSVTDTLPDAVIEVPATPPAATESDLPAVEGVPAPAANESDMPANPADNQSSGQNSNAGSDQEDSEGSSQESNQNNNQGQADSEETKAGESATEANSTAVDESTKE